MAYLFEYRLLWAVAIVAALGATEPVKAQSPIRTNDKTVHAAFRAVVAKPSACTVRVLCNGKEAALGTVVGEDGWIITKNSELVGKIVVKTRDGKAYDATIEGVEDKFDLAMLKIKASGLKVIEWAPAKSAEQGDWLAAVGVEEDPVAVGVVSVAAREPKSIEMPAPAPRPNSGFMGVLLGDEEGNPTIAQVQKGEAADKAGLKVGDLVLTVQGEAVTEVEGLVRKIQTYKEGDVIKMKIKRDGKEKEIQVTLGKRPPPKEMDRGEMQNKMGSTLSNRKGGFPAILQSDLVIPHTACGGPCVNLDGKAIGVFIARAGRTESYVIPSENVNALLGDLKSGKLKPKKAEPTVNVTDLEAAVSKAKLSLDVKQRALRRAQDADEPDESLIKVLTDEVTALKKKYEEAQKALREAKGEKPNGKEKKDEPEKNGLKDK